MNNLKIISLGLGVQSTAVYMMSSLNNIKRADYAIFADTGAELPETYKTLKHLKKWSKINNGIPIHIIKEKNLLSDLLDKTNSQGKRWASIPAFTESGGMVRRQCTGEYKIQQVMKKIRQLYNLKKYKRLPKTEVWLGISLDEIERMKTSQLPRVEYYYPLIEKRLSRGDCYKFFKNNNFPIPYKSSCIFCPFHSNKNWKDLKENHPKEWKKCIDVDEAIRNSSKRGVKDKLYLHRALIPLKDVEFADQQELFMCEEGFCGL